MRVYMERLRARGELLEVHREIAAKHELAAVTQAAHKRWNKPILFHKVSGSTLPVLTNIYGSRERLAEILGIGPLDFCRRWSDLANLGAAADYPLKRAVPRSPDLVDCRLSDLPLLTYSERDGGPYFTSAMFIAKEPETGVPNLSFHRSMYISDQELRCRLAPRHHLTLYHEKAEKMGKPLEAAMLLGPPPTSFLAAAAPVPYDVDELEVAAKLVDIDVLVDDMNDVMWAIMTRSRSDRDTIIIPDTPTFYRDPHRDHWGRMAIDATAPFERRAEFVRKRVPGADSVDLARYFEGAR